MVVQNSSGRLAMMERRIEALQRQLDRLSPQRPAEVAFPHFVRFAKATAIAAEYPEDPPSFAGGIEKGVPIRYVDIDFDESLDAAVTITPRSAAHQRFAANMTGTNIVADQLCVVMAQGNGKLVIISALWRLLAMTLTTDIAAGSATANIVSDDFATTIASETVLDAGGIFAGGVSGSNGWCKEAAGVYSILQLSCGGS